MSDLEFRFWTLVGVGVFCVLFAMPLFTLVVPDHLDEGHGLAAALWQPGTRNLTIALSVCVLLFATLSAVYTFGIPRTLIRRAVAVDDAGLTVVERPVWWFGGTATRIGWADVRAVDAGAALFRATPGAAHGAGAAVDVHLHRPVPGLPLFAACGYVRGGTSEGADPGGYRVRFGGPGRQMRRDLRRLADALHRARPDLWRGPAPSDDAAAA
ncbi:hypothetical protein [Murinocardiopsis flavida]|uniref:hypothetical protein n=1 Tax=Murinocardiopsis flavida TaxID=645275 RepID=UPI000D0E2303|nr:hypothetical protein [Murinocardiopsis flavida]